VLDFSGGRATSLLSINRDLGLLVDNETGEVVGLAVPEHLAGLLVQQSAGTTPGDSRAAAGYRSSSDLPEASAALIEDLALIAA
jgi:hypothetical protein